MSYGACCRLPSVCGMLYAICCMLHVAGWVMYFVGVMRRHACCRCSYSTCYALCCMLSVRCGQWDVGCGMLFVVCCMV